MLVETEPVGRASRKPAGLKAGNMEMAPFRSLPVGVLPGLIGEVRPPHPGRRIWLREFVHRDELNDAVMAGLSDLAVGPRPTSWSGPVLGLGWEEFVVILPPGDPAGEAPGSLNLRRLSDRDWILYQPGHGLDDVVLFACAQAGFTPRPAMRTGQAEAAVRLAASGLGVAMVPVNVVSEPLARTVRHLHPPVVRELAAYARTHFTPAAEAFAAVVTAGYGPPRPPRSIVFR